MTLLSSIPSWLYGLLAAASAVGCEAYYRANVGALWGVRLWPGLILALVTNFGIWGVMQTENPLGLAIVFSLWTAALRTALVLHRGESVSAAAWVAFGLVVLASIVKVVLSK